MQEGFKIGEERKNKVIILIIIFKAIKNTYTEKIPSQSSEQL